MKESGIKNLESMMQAGLEGVDSSIRAKQKEIEMWRERERKENELYYGQINRVQSEISRLEQQKNEIRQKYADKINQAQIDLEGAYQDTMTTIDKSSIDAEELKSTKGYLGFIQSLVAWTGWNYDKIMLFFQLFIAIVFEFTIILFHVEYESRKPENNDIGRVRGYRLNKKQANSKPTFTPKKDNSKPTPGKVNLEVISGKK